MSESRAHASTKPERDDRILWLALVVLITNIGRALLKFAAEIRRAKELGAEVTE